MSFIDSDTLLDAEYLIFIIRGHAGYELIYNQLTSGKSEENNSFSKLSTSFLSRWNF